MNASSTDQSRFFNWKVLVVLWAAFLGCGLFVGMAKVSAVQMGGRNAAIKADMAALGSALRLYAMKSGRLPTTKQGLAVLVELPGLEPVPERWSPQVRDSEALQDPWGNEYVYSLISDEQGFELLSVGPDGLAGTEDDISTSYEPVKRRASSSPNL